LISGKFAIRNGGRAKTRIDMMDVVDLIIIAHENKSSFNYTIRNWFARTYIGCRYFPGLICD